MQKENRRNTKLLGEPTQASASGVAFSLASILPVILSMLVQIALAKTDYLENEWGLYIIYLLPQLAFAITAVWCAWYTKTPLKRAVRNQKCKPRYFLLALILQIGLLFLSELNALFLQFLGHFGYEDAGIRLPSMDGFGFLGVLLVVAVLPAVFEEIMFRGVLLKGLKSFGEVGSVLLCGALFALYHQNPAQTLYQFCCGAAYALIAVRAGSVLPTIFAHCFNNALILTLTKFGVESFPVLVLFTILILSLICLIISLVWIFAFDKRKAYENGQKPTYDKNERKRFFVYASVGIAICALTWLTVLISGL